MVRLEDINQLSIRVNTLQEEILANEYQDPDAVKYPPEFKVGEAANLIGVSRKTFNSILNENSIEDVPRIIEYKIVKDEQGNEKKKELPPRFTMEMLEQIRQFLDRNGQKSNLQKNRPIGTKKPLVIMIGNLKGGASKTQVAIHFAQWLALQGKKVLAIDSDPQGSFSSMLGFFPYQYDDLPEEAYYVQDENTLANLYIDNRPLIPAKTYWTNLDIITANIAGYSSEFFLPVRFRDYDDMYFNVLQRALETSPEDWEDTFSNYYSALKKKGEYQEEDFSSIENVYRPENYDVVIIDTPPSYSFATQNAIYASDGIIVPVPAAHLDVLATGTYFQQMYDFLLDLSEIEGKEKSFEFLLGLRSKMTLKEDQIKNGYRIGTVFREMQIDESFMFSKTIETATSKNKTAYEMSGDKDVSNTTVRETIKNLESIFVEVEKEIQKAWNRQKELELG